MKLIEAPLELIEVGERRRTDYGDIGALAKGIQRVGLLEPVIVDRIGRANRYRLVAGERRLKAVQMLKWQSIPAQLLDELSEDELRDIELEENENRKGLTEQERNRDFKSSKKLVERGNAAAQIIQSAPAQKDPRGRKPAGGVSLELKAGALGIGKASLVRAEQHVATAERFPFMQGADWRQSDVLRVRERLEDLPETERDDVAGVLGCAKLLDPPLTVKLVENIAAKKPAERQEIYRLSQSEDSRDRSLALTKAAQLPPMPDPRLTSIAAALDSLNRATKPFPQDPLTPRIEAVIQELKAIRTAVKEVSFDARRNPGKEQIQ